MPLQLRRLLAVTVVLALFGSSMAWAEPAEMPPTIPIVETGIVAPISYRPRGYPGAGDPANAVSVGLTGRVELTFILYLAAEFGLTNSFDATGRIAYGLGMPYDVNKDVGVGARVFFTTIFEDLLPGNFGGHSNNYVLAELCGRYRQIIGRFRFPVLKGDNAGYDESLIGASFRIPVALHLFGRGGWQAGLDYERLTRANTNPSATDGGDGYVIHRFGLTFMLAI